MIDGLTLAVDDELIRADYVATGHRDDKCLILVPLRRLGTDIASAWLVLDSVESAVWRLLERRQSFAALVGGVALQLPEETEVERKVATAVKRLASGGVLEIVPTSGLVEG